MCSDLYRVMYVWWCSAGRHTRSVSAYLAEDQESRGNDFAYIWCVDLNHIPMGYVWMYVMTSIFVVSHSPAKAKQQGSNVKARQFCVYSRFFSARPAYSHNECDATTTTTTTPTLDRRARQLFLVTQFLIIISTAVEERDERALRGIYL